MIPLIDVSIRRIALPIALAFALVVGACDSTGVSPQDTEQSPVTVSFATKSGNSASKADADLITDRAGRAIELNAVEVLLRKVKFKSENSEREVDAGPVVINIPLDSTPDVKFETELPQGIWEQIELEIDERRDEEDLDFPRGVSIRATGTWTPISGPSRTFTFESDVEMEREIELNPPLEVEESRPYNITLVVNIDRWFRDEAGMLISPLSANDGGPNEARVENNIVNSFEGFEDGDGDGDPFDDANDDDGDDDDGDDDVGAASEVEVKGTIEALTDTSITVRGRTFRVTSQTHVDGENTDQLPFSALVVGDLVEVKGRYNSDDVLVAVEIERKSPDDDDRKEVEVKGRVEAIYTDSLTVQGSTFRVTDATEIRGENDQSLSLTDLERGDVVEVEGYYDEDGVLIAEEIERESPDDVGARGDLEVEGRIQALTDTSITVANRTFLVTEYTEVNGDDEDTSLTFSDLREGDFVEVKGYINDEDVLVAKEIERDDD